MKELAALAYRDTTQENRDFWKNEMGNAMREIQATYDDKLESMRGELETYYNMKVELRDYLIVSEAYVGMHPHHLTLFISKGSKHWLTSLITCFS